MMFVMSFECSTIFAPYISNSLAYLVEKSCRLQSSSHIRLSFFFSIIYVHLFTNNMMEQSFKRIFAKFYIDQKEDNFVIIPNKF